MKQMITRLGPTASGKTPLATALACSGAEIISADSRQVYRRMDIGTGKDLDDYSMTVKGSPINIPYHLIDIAEPGTKYNLFEYQRDFYDAYNYIIGVGHMPILCGGTGLYIEAVLKGYQLSPVPQNPELRQRLEGKSLDELTEMLVELGNNLVRNNTGGTKFDNLIPFVSTIFATSVVSNLISLIPIFRSPGVSIDREERRKKITCRLKQRLENGMVEEVKGLLDEGIPADDLIYYGLEYKFLTEYILGRTTYDEMFQRLEIAIHQFAKRQMTWFRGMERRGFTIHWIDAMLPMDEKVQEIIRIWQQ